MAASREENNYGMFYSSAVTSHAAEVTFLISAARFRVAHPAWHFSSRFNEDRGDPCQVCLVGERNYSSFPGCRKLSYRLKK